MSKTVKTWLFIALTLTIVGAVTFTAAMCAINWDFSALSTVEYVNNTYEVTEEFKDLAIKTSTANVTILPSPDGVCRVECYEDAGITHSVYVDGETLRIVAQDKREWHEYINVDGNTASIAVYLPDGSCRSISIISSTSDARLEGLSLSSISLKLTTGDVTITDTALSSNAWLYGSTGDVNLKNVSCKGVISTGGTGDISLQSVVAKEKLDITRTTGDVRFIRSDAPEIYVTVSTGDVTGSLLSGKMFSVETGTGDVRVPQDADGGKCTVTTSTGDVNITVAK